MFVVYRKISNLGLVLDLSITWPRQQEVGLRFSHKDLTIDNFCGLLTNDEVKMAGYLPSSLFACLWTETADVLGCKKKKNEANIKPS